jgi:hypothetical protein
LTSLEFPDQALSVWRLFLLQQDDLQWQLRRCEWCKRWMFAHFATQRFCAGTDCKKKCRENTEKYKEYRRKKSREYYRELFPNAKKRVKP